MAIIARWRMPPENSCGYCAARRSGKGTATRARSSTARFMAWRSLIWRSWMRIISVIWAPTVSTGFRAVIGSWKIIAMRLPRRRRSASGRPRYSSPSSFTEPVTVTPGPVSPIAASIVTLLPEPDSPTTARTSPRSTERSTPLTASRPPAGPGKTTRRSRTSNNGGRVAAAAAGAAFMSGALTCGSSGRTGRGGRRRRRRSRAPSRGSPCRGRRRSTTNRSGRRPRRSSGPIPGSAAARRGR